MPISRLKSEHWVITLDKLVLVAGPLTDTEVVTGLLIASCKCYLVNKLISGCET